MPLNVQYKCRKCGQTNVAGSVPEFLDMVKIIQNIPDPKNMQCHLIGFHHCEDGSIGVTDFIGAEQYKFEREEQSEK